jgi:hypothetical protein
MLQNANFKHCRKKIGLSLLFKCRQREFWAQSVALASSQLGKCTHELFQIKYDEEYLSSYIDSLHKFNYYMASSLYIFLISYLMVKSLRAVFNEPELQRGFLQHHLMNKMFTTPTYKIKVAPKNTRFLADKICIAMFMCGSIYLKRHTSTMISYQKLEKI